MDVEIKCPENVHDARVYTKSSVNKAFKSSSFAVKNQKLISGCTQVHPVLLVLPNVIKEYGNCIESSRFTVKRYLRSAHCQIESALARLKLDDVHSINIFLLRVA